MVRRLLLISALLLVLPAASEARVPPLLDYQGYLQTTPDTLLNTPVRIVFSIYETETGGTPLWTETHDVTVSNGQFHVLLGSVTPLPDSLFAGDNRYLGLSVGRTSELLPRQRIVSVAYALRAAQADGVTGRDISPRSIALAGAPATLDSAGNFSAPRISTDSLVVGGKGVIDRSGAWTGPGIAARTSGMVLDTLLVTNIQDTLNVSSSPEWRKFATRDPFETFVTLQAPSILDIRFQGAVTTLGRFETRIVVEVLEGSAVAQRIVNAGNISGAASDGAVSDVSTVGNNAILSLAPGRYRVSVEQRGDSNVSLLKTAVLTVRVFSR